MFLAFYCCRIQITVFFKSSFENHRFLKTSILVALMATGYRNRYLYFVRPTKMCENITPPGLCFPWFSREPQNLSSNLWTSQSSLPKSGSILLRQKHRKYINTVLRSRCRKEPHNLGGAEGSDGFGPDPDVHHEKCFKNEQ
jgi:hypothetical protein